ncbi:transglycosylase domain-containing protein [Aurantimonas sp. Leaf443]|uniref:transglycosylase domain-containing protein n=1 Tax=Aurantimonas sp. Leaf443 TaxID=1736378 RepID=UPI0006F6836D|nr:transglycosylase domain-containing protein [Aurantimonas sp. Leaf443]KQT85303.1 penicillin-binding protein 1A [Aurantimonas sp. Leaf443]
MAARRQGDRIEPTFGGPAADDDAAFRISADDRAVPTAMAAARPRPNRREERRSRAEEARAAKAQRRSGGGSGGSGKRPRRRRGLLGFFLNLAFMAVFWGTIAAALGIGYVAMTLPQEAWAIPERPPNVKIVSVAGELMANRGLTGGKAVSLDEMSPYVPKAVIAIEDRRFYDHWGVDPIGILRAFSENMAAGETVQGGSTLTQQLAKNIFLSPEQSFKRKAQEAVLALWLEQKFTKDQILEMYLNRVYFGSGATGIEAAARRYFDKSASDLTLGESALLAGLLKAPSRLSPARDPEAAQARAEIVLASMRDEGFVSPEEYAAAKDQKPSEARSYWTGAQHYAADIVMRDLKSLVGDVKGDVIVETTIDLGLEKAADTAVRRTINGAKQNVSQGALVAIDGTGAIRALVGGLDYGRSQFNRAVDAKRQPGSTFKPFVYETALEQGWRPETVVNDAPTRIGNWTPQNYDNRFRGPVTLADALRQSLNTVAAQLVEAVGPASVIETASRMGIQSTLTDNASIALGTSEVSLLELTSAFVPFANGGYQAKPHLVNRVTTEDGKVLWERGAEVPPVIVAPEIVSMMNAMLERVVSSGTGRKAAIEGWQAAGKTGTTQDFKDAWFVGYTANLTTGVWLGNDNGAKMKKVTGGSLPAEAWHDFMTAAHEGLPSTPLPGDYRIGDPSAPLTADSSVSGGYDTELPLGEGPAESYDPGGVPLPPEGVPDRGVVISDGPPPAGVTLEGPVSVGRESDRSIFRRLFGG